MMDNLVTCKHCGGNACYEQNVSEDVKTWLCFGCGFTTSTVMNEDGEATKQTIESSPELYKDLMFVDDDKRAWFPATVTLPEKGMVFIDGTGKDRWQWAAVLPKPLSEEEKKSGRFPKGQEFKMDMQNIKYYKQKEFMDALEHINFYAV